MVISARIEDLTLSLTELRIVTTLSGLTLYMEDSSLAASVAGIEVNVWVSVALSRFPLLVDPVDADDC
ncbi:hypothetical protein D3C72_2483330 [compost metagenome]